MIDLVDRLYPMQTAPAGNKTTLVLTGGNHNLIGREDGALATRARALGTALEQAQLLDDVKAKAMLAAPPREGGHWLRR